MQKKIIAILFIITALYFGVPKLLGFILGQPSVSENQTVYSVNEQYKPRRIPLILNPEKPDQKQFGDLTYLWGYELELDHPDFGGLSSMTVFPRRHEVAPLVFKLLNDRGKNMTLTLTESGNSHDITISHFIPITPCYRGQKVLDSEALALFKKQDGSVIPFVSFERDHCVTRNGQTMALPQEFKDMAFNGGIEAMTIHPDGRLVMLSEEPLEGAKHHSLWISTLTANAIVKSSDYERLLYQAPEGFSPTDMAALNDGSLLIIHRRWRPTEGTNIIVSHLKAGYANSETRSAVQKPDMIAHFTPDMSVDNMEGLTATEHADGSVTLYMISDDNFNRNVQKNLMLAFRWMPPKVTTEK